MIGKTFSHYRITEKLGARGMGEVYRAEDTNLNRQVAIKVLPDIFAGDPERLARFEREAKLLASLSHPNIAAIYGLEKTDGSPFLVMELADDVTVPAGLTLTVTPGQVVKLRSGKYLQIQGTLTALGTEVQPIIFTSWRDDSAWGDSNSDGASTGLSGDWETLYFTADSDASVLEHVEIRHAGRVAAVRVMAGSVLGCGGSRPGVRGEGVDQGLDLRVQVRIGVDIEVVCAVHRVAERRAREDVVDDDGARVAGRRPNRFARENVGRHPG